MQPHTRTSIASAPCPACGGPPNHPGLCVDREGEVLPAYAALARMWHTQGRVPLSVDEMIDLEDLLDEWDEGERPGSAQEGS